MYPYVLYRQQTTPRHQAWLAYRETRLKREPPTLLVPEKWRGAWRELAMADPKRRRTRVLPSAPSWSTARDAPEYKGWMGAQWGEGRRFAGQSGSRRWLQQAFMASYSWDWKWCQKPGDSCIWYQWAISLHFVLRLSLVIIYWTLCNKNNFTVPLLLLLLLLLW